MNDFMQLWRQGNNEGRGYAACECQHEECHCRVDELDIGELIDLLGCGVAVYDAGTKYVVVGYAHGPWAVDVPKQ